MVNSQNPKLLAHSFKLAPYLLCLLCLYSPRIQASQDAMVVSEKALIYADREMTSAIGYVRRGKKLKVGEIARNKAQVYPVSVSGKIAYIRVLDVTTEKESMDSTRLVAERFQKQSVPVLQSKVSLSYFAYSSEVGTEVQNDTLSNNDIAAWTGLSLKGEAIMKNSFDFQIITNFMTMTLGDETIRAVEFGFGGAYRLIDRSRFSFKLEVQALGIPFSSYAVADDFRVNGYGYTLGAGVSMNYRFGDNWGVEFFGGLYYTNFFGFDAPAPYEEFSPTFSGNRMGLGLSYRY